MANPNTKQMYGAAHIGFNIQRDIGLTTIYRLRRGNGHYGSIAGELYQDKYDYFVPSSITHVNGDASRTCFAAAVAGWQILSAQGKKWHNDLAHHIRNLSGFNLFIRRYMQTNYP